MARLPEWGSNCPLQKIDDTNRESAQTLEFRRRLFEAVHTSVCGLFPQHHHPEWKYLAGLDDVVAELNDHLLICHSCSSEIRVLYYAPPKALRSFLS